MANAIDDFVPALRAQLAGEVLTAADDGYDDGRRVWNATIDRRPAVIAMCTSPTDVAAAVTFAVEHGLEVAVRGGAHSVAGQSTVDGGMMVNLARMDSVRVDPQTRQARVGGGALLGQLIEAAQEHGLAMPVGVVSHTGVGGLVLGGGMGWLSRKYGLSIDCMTGAEVVTADGQILRVDESSHPDLFWALRGGGGNFGIVTEFEFALHPVDPMVHLTLLFWPVELGREALRTAREVVGSLPAEVNVIVGALNAPPAPFVPVEHQLQPGYAALVVEFDGGDAHEDVVARLRRAGPTLFEFATPMPYVALQQMLDEANAWGNFNYDKGCYLEDLTDGAIDVVATHVPRKQSPMSMALFYRLDGAYSEVPEDATAFSGGRSPRYNLFIIAVAPTPELLEADREWVRELHAALQPHTIAGTYVNALEEGDDNRVRAAYGPEKYERLVQVKRAYDPANLFRRNANINPAVSIPEPRQVDLTTKTRV